MPDLSLNGLVYTLHSASVSPMGSSGELWSCLLLLLALACSCLDLAHAGRPSDTNTYHGEAEHTKSWRQWLVIAVLERRLQTEVPGASFPVLLLLQTGVDSLRRIRDA